MAIPIYLAMTAEEYAFCAEKPAHIAWMACHFSPYCTGITNLPPKLPEDAMVILNDRTPIHRHDPAKICDQLKQIPSSGILLDFQRPNVPETEQLVSVIVSELSRPVGVSEGYAAKLNCPVFLPPIPPHILAEEYLHPFQDREIWLEVSLGTTEIRVNKNGAKTKHFEQTSEKDLRHYDEALHCSYITEINKNEAVFTLLRKKTDLDKLMESAEKLGVTRAIGLYQELK